MPLWRVTCISLRSAVQRRDNGFCVTINHLNYYHRQWVRPCSHFIETSKPSTRVLAVGQCTVLLYFRSCGVRSHRNQSSHVFIGALYNRMNILHRSTSRASPPTPVIPPPVAAAQSVDFIVLKVLANAALMSGQSAIIPIGCILTITPQPADESEASYGAANGEASN